MTNKTVDPKQIAMLKELMGVQDISLRDRFAIAYVSSARAASADETQLAYMAYEYADKLMQVRGEDAGK